MKLDAAAILILLLILLGVVEAAHNWLHRGVRKQGH
jgi:hypothetical protein